MTDEAKQNGEARQDVASERDLKVALEEAIKRGQTLMRLEMPNDISLALIEKMLQETATSKLNMGALVSVAPRFDWWVVGGLWPIYPQGWTVLLKRMPFQGQVRPEVVQAAQQSKLVKG